MDTLSWTYEWLHEPLVMTLCFGGIAGHCFSIAVLSRLLSPTNLLLLSMSCSQLVLCVNFLYSTAFKFGAEDLCLSDLWSYSWTLTLLVSVNLSVLVHMAGVFHVVALSIIRYFSLRQLSTANSNIVWFTYSKCIRTLLIIYSSVLVICIPLYFHSEVRESEKPDEKCVEMYPQLSDFRPSFHLAFSANDQLQQINFWLFGSICKIVPCSLLLTMSVLLLRQLQTIKQMSIRFQNAGRQKQHHRTTTLILMIMIFFVFVEFPQGVLAVAQSASDLPYSELIGDLFEMLTLLTSNVIFGLFVAMNSQLRSALLDTLHRCLPLIFHRQSVKENRLFENSVSETHRLVGHVGERRADYGNTGF